ncbi:MAG: hypothetical protein AAF514_06035 [Verrucomicrobiota bacterium]
MRVETTDDEYERDNLADFALWKARKEEDGANFWESPWGEGRPGWHLECSAMSMKYLGESFDMHSGGVDLVFPHHENEIAQSEAATGKTFAQLWFHITHLLVDGGKMSKSLGNLYTLDDLAEKGHSAGEVRYVLLSGHYRRPLNFTLDQLTSARQALKRLKKFEAALLERVPELEVPDYASLLETNELGSFEAAFASLARDLNTAEALGHVFTITKNLDPAHLDSEAIEKEFLGFHRLLAALGLTLPSDEAKTEIPAEIETLGQKRWEAKQAKDWGTADAVRDELTTKGWQIKDTREGYEILPAD